MKWVALLAVLGLAGCTSPVRDESPDPVLVTCAPECVQPCQTGVPLWEPPDAAAPGAWDWIRPQVVDVLEFRLKACEVSRKACVECLRGVEKEGLVTWPQGRE
jgi:hypothetical protein